MLERSGPAQGQAPRISELWAWCALDPMTDTEGIVAARLHDGGSLPLVGATRALVEKWEPMARLAVEAAEPPRPVLRLRRFVAAEEST